MVAQKLKTGKRGVGEKDVNNLRKMTVRRAKDIIEQNARTDSAIGKSIMEAAIRAGRMSPTARKVVKKASKVQKRTKTGKKTAKARPTRASKPRTTTRKAAAKKTAGKRAAKPKAAVKPAEKTVKFSERLRNIAMAAGEGAREYFGINHIGRMIAQRKEAAKERADARKRAARRRRRRREQRRRERMESIRRVSEKASDFARRHRMAIAMGAIVAATAVVSFTAGVITKAYLNDMRGKAHTVAVSKAGEENTSVKYYVPQMPSTMAESLRLYGETGALPGIRPVPKVPEPEEMALVPEERKEIKTVAKLTGKEPAEKKEKQMARAPERKAAAAKPKPAEEPKQEVAKDTTEPEKVAMAVERPIEVAPVKERKVLVAMPEYMAYDDSSETDAKRFHMEVDINKILRKADDNIWLKFHKKPVEISTARMARDGTTKEVDVCKIAAEDRTYYVDAYKSGGLFCGKVANIVITEVSKNGSVGVLKITVDRDGRLGGNAEDLDNVSVAILPREISPQ